MKAEQTYQPQLVNQDYQPPLLSNSGRFNEGDEGGLDLGQVVAAIRRRAFIIFLITCGVTTAAVLKALNEPPIYQGQFEILIEPETIETQVISSTNPDTLSSQEEVANVKDKAVMLKILKSPEILDSIVSQVQSVFPEVSYSNLFNNLDIVTIGDRTQVLTVTYQNANKELVKSILEIVSQTYLDYSLTTRQAGITRGIEFVENQLPQLRLRVQSLQLELQKIRQQNNLVDPEMKGQELSALLNAFGKQKLETQIQLQEAKTLYASLENELIQQGAESSLAVTLNQNPRYQSLLTQIQEIDSQIAKDSVLLFDESPEISTLKNQRQNLLPLIQQEKQRVLRAGSSRIAELETRDRILDETINRLNQEVKQLSSILRDYNDIRRELAIATENLNQFLSKRESLRIDVAQKEAPWRILLPPGEPSPKSASLNRNIVLGTITGLVLGILVALALDKFSNRIYTARDVREVTQLPILGIIPFDKELAQLNTTDPTSDLLDQVDRHLVLRNGHQANGGYPISSFFEAFRSLYTSLSFLRISPSLNSLVISSPTPKDGKSTVAIYLAQAAAELGQRVLLVDTDLRNPSLHRRLNLTNNQGLVDILSSDTLDLNSVIQRWPLEDNLFILTAGANSQDATRLLASQKMQDLMDKLQGAFDLVIYKAPVLLGLADTYLLANHTNGVLLVTGLGKLKRSILEQALDDLKLSNTRVLGIVTNYVKQTQNSWISKS